MTSVASAVPVSSGGVEVGSAASASAPPAGAQTAPAAASSGPSGPSTRSLVLDLGGDTLKVGWAGSSAPNRIIPNCAVKNKRDTKWLVGDQFLPEEVRRPTPNNHPGIPGKMAPTTQIVHKITDYSGLYVRRPHERGFVVNWELENQVLSRALHRSVLDPTSSLSASSAATLVEESRLLVTLPVCAPAPLAKDLDENVLEKWGFRAYRRTNGAPLAHRGMLEEMYPPTGAANAAAQNTQTNAATPAAGGREALHKLCALVVDTGYSFTHVMPVYHGRTIKSAVKRVNVGGKLMTNYLKELISYRAWNMMDETYIINDVKEKLCYVSTDFERELQAAKRSRKVAEKLRREYVLPNGSTVLSGYVRDVDSTVHPDDQVLVMANERFSVPEVLFTPLDIGLGQCGIVEAIVAAVEATPAWMHALMYENVVIVGGNAKLPNFRARLERELRPRVPIEYKLRTRIGDDPVTTCWRGGSLLAAESLATGTAAGSLEYVTKAEFAEYGSEALTRKWDGDEDEEESEDMDTQ